MTRHSERPAWLSAWGENGVRISRLHTTSSPDCVTDAVLTASGTLAGATPWAHAPETTSASNPIAIPTAPLRTAEGL